MSNASDGTGFWTSLPGILTAAAALVSAVTGVLVLVLGDGDTDPGRATTGTSDSPSSVGTADTSPEDVENDDVVAAASGRWIGTIASPGGRDPFTLDLRVDGSCRLDAVCGEISVSSLPCHGRITLVEVSGRVLEFSVDAFSEDSGPGCTEGAGEYVEVRADGTLGYSVGYADWTGVLTRSG